jgi:hypothetical protein
MYWNNQEIDTRTYPERCPGCNATKWLDFDWETGLGYCDLCGWDLDNNFDAMSSSTREK